MSAALRARVRRLPTGHMPLLSMSVELTDLIVEAADSLTPLRELNPSSNRTFEEEWQKNGD
ncbi:hypothetical protein [Mycobacterium sp. E1747]|uniref:hypothetical protein n=1 Tax=Mycobacterium sp. E1747 TaxID=1834128 RepID=UPI000A5CD7AE|nr:hypothetical protein [Mycobacterium sp. E1747]